MLSAWSDMMNLKALAKKYKDRSPDFADLCFVRMRKLFPKYPVMTVDSDFRVYRRNKRDVIPFNCPTGR